MELMRKPSSSTFVLALIVLITSSVVGCGRQPRTPIIAADTPTQSTVQASSRPQEVPFDNSQNNEGISPSESLVPVPHRLPAGTAVTIRLQSSVSSATARSGDAFNAVLDEPIIIGGQTVAPRGAQVTGKVLVAKPSGRLTEPGYLRLTLSSISVNGKTLPVQSSSIYVKGKSHEKRDWASVGGGTAAGALIGGLAGGGKGALIGSTVGAAGGTGYAYTTGKKDVGFGAERRLTFRLTGPLDVKG
jgi:hypothetical protein